MNKSLEIKSEKQFTLKYKFISISVILFILIFIANVISLFSLNVDQFSLFHKYKKVYELETWNIPSNVDADINGDNIKDRVSWTGCLILSGTMDENIVAEQYHCDGNDPRKIRVFSLKGTSSRQVRLSYLGEQENGTWDIVLIKNLNTEVYNISNQGKVLPVKPSFSLTIDIVLYFISHMFVLLIGM